MPGNGQNGNPNGNDKNQVALERDDRGNLQEVHDPRNAVVLGTQENVTISGEALTTELTAIAGALDGYSEDDLRGILADQGVLSEGEPGAEDDSAALGDVVDLGAGNDSCGATTISRRARVTISSSAAVATTSRSATAATTCCSARTATTS